MIKSSKHTLEYFNGIKNLSKIVDKNKIEKLAKEILKIKRKNGRFFF